MAKRRSTRKKTATSTRKNIKKVTSIQKQTKTTPKIKGSGSKVAKNKTTRKKRPSLEKTAKKKASVKKKTTPKTVAKQRKVNKPSRRKPSAKTRAFQRKLARGEVPGPPEPGLPLKEVRARLGLIGPQIAALRWLDALYLHGSALLEEARLERLDFIAIYRGLRSAARLKAAEAELRELIAAVLPVEFDLTTGTAGIGRLLGEGNPAAQAHLGHSEPVFTRDT